jgi:hypothetical protein
MTTSWNVGRFGRISRTVVRVDVIVAFAAALLALRLAGDLARRWRQTGRSELGWWAWSLAAYAVAAAAIAWGEAAGWDARAFRVYYAAGGLLTAALLGAGSLVLAGVPRTRTVALLFTGLAVGVALAMPVHGSFAAHGIPAAQDHLAFLPARLLAILANVLGTFAVVAVALRSIRQRPLGNALIVLGVAAAATGSGLAGLGASGTSLGIAAGALLLYAGFVAPASLSARTVPAPSR